MEPLAGLGEGLAVGKQGTDGFLGFPGTLLLQLIRSPILLPRPEKGPFVIILHLSPGLNSRFSGFRLPTPDSPGCRAGAKNNAPARRTPISRWKFNSEFVRTGAADGEALAGCDRHRIPPTGLFQIISSRFRPVSLSGLYWKTAWASVPVPTTRAFLFVRPSFTISEEPMPVDSKKSVQMPQPAQLSLPSTACRADWPSPT